MSFQEKDLHIVQVNMQRMIDYPGYLGIVTLATVFTGPVTSHKHWCPTVTRSWPAKGFVGLRHFRPPDGVSRDRGVEVTDCATVDGLNRLAGDFYWSRNQNYWWKASSESLGSCHVVNNSCSRQTKDTEQTIIRIQ